MNQPVNHRYEIELQTTFTEIIYVDAGNEDEAIQRAIHEMNDKILDGSANSDDEALSIRVMPKNELESNS